MGSSQPANRASTKAGAGERDLDATGCASSQCLSPIIPEGEEKGKPRLKHFSKNFFKRRNKTDDPFIM